MHAKRFGRGMGPNQYTPAYHLARPVQCAGCGVHLHKDHFYVYYGSRCRPCWEAFVTASPPLEPPPSAAVAVEPADEYEEESADGASARL